MRRTPLLTGCAVAVVLIMLGYKLRSSQVENSVAAAPTSLVAAAALTMQTDSFKPAPAVAVAAANSATLMEDLKAASDYAILFHKLLSQPEKGGVYYANNLLIFCATAYKLEPFGRIPDTGVPPEIAQDSRRMAAYTTAAGLCHNVRNLTWNSEIAKGIPKDRLGKLEGAMFRGSAHPSLPYAFKGEIASSLQMNAAERRAALHAALANPDPLFMFDPFNNAPRLTFLKETRNSADLTDVEVSMAFNGRWLDDDDAQALNVSGFLLACHYGQVCDTPMDWLLITNCAQRGQCYDTRQAYLEGELYPQYPGLRERVAKLSAELQQAIDSKNVDAFMPPA